ncbi:MAG: NUDIX domain-containing protein, partial [Geminicoccaceae bacterium]
MTLSARAKTFLASIVLRQRLLSRWAHKRLPAKRMATCVLFFDEGDRLLVVKPTYRKDWLLPGGTVERDESPWDGARREVLEEIGLEVGQLHLAAVDWRGPDDDVDESMHFAFYGGVLTPDHQAAIRPDGIEIADY